MQSVQIHSRWESNKVDIFVNIFVDIFVNVFVDIFVVDILYAKCANPRQMGESNKVSRNSGATEILFKAFHKLCWKKTIY